MKARDVTRSAAYDDIVDHYDEHWSVLVRAPQERLTKSLELVPGLRCADLACGTGLDTLDMLQRVAPGEVVAVDTSEMMLRLAQRRANEAGLPLTIDCQDAASFIAETPQRSFDVITLRFCLGYLDFQNALAQLPRLLRPCGRVGLLTILSTSAPQAYEAYMELARELGLTKVERSGPPSVELICQQLRAGGCRDASGWKHSFRAYFADGSGMGEFLRKTGIATHPLIDCLPAEVTRPLWQRFEEKVERFRTDQGLPLDFDIAGVIGTRAPELR